MTLHRPPESGTDLQLAERYATSVPRYTSYPTAPHFSDAVDSIAYANWLQRVEPKQPVLLYLHMPFCKEMCWYCGCFTKVTRSYEPVRQYVDALLQEIDLVAENLPNGVPASFVHWGGGSPTIMEAGDWERVMSRLGERFLLSETTETAVEMDPRTTTEDYVRSLARVGVNRVSIGVQEFDPDIQRAINRVQPFPQTAQVVEWLRAYGIDRLNLDLMYGLPGQTVEHVKRMTEMALVFEPQRIALFGYAHVPWMKSHQRLIDESALPGTSERWLSAEAAAAILTEAGYRRIGLDHFARPDDPMLRADGQLNRNFQGYTSDDAETLIGFGASAIGSFSQGYVQNVASIRGYQKTIAEGQLATTRGFELRAEDRLRRSIIERIMCDLSVDVAAECQDFSTEPNALDQDMAQLQPMASDGLLSVDGYKITVSERGRPLVRNIAAVFDAYLSLNVARHSRAV